MKVLATISADFEQTFLGLPSRLRADLAGETVIRRTIRRVRQATQIAAVHLLVPGPQEAIAREAVAGLDVTVETHPGAAPAWRTYVSTGRKWAMNSWRGGLAGATVFDEFTDPHVLDALVRREGADAVANVPAAAPLLDPGLLDRLVEHYVENRDSARLAVVQTAPGLSGIVYQADLLADIVNAGHPPTRMMSYLPDDPHRDITLQPCTMLTDAAVAHASGRCIADTSTAIWRIERMLADLSAADPERTPDALTVSQWLLADRRTPQDVPAELEIEITTDDPSCESKLRPRGSALQRQASMALDTFRRIIDGLVGDGERHRDDRLVVLGGFGDPLMHPEWPRFAQYAREAGVLGVAVRTPAVHLDEAAAEAMLDAQIDVLSVPIDAATAQTYRNLHNSDHHERVLANLARFFEMQNHRKCPRPLVVAEIVKTAATMDEIEPFYDRWIRTAGSAVIAGPSRYAGQWPDLSVMNMAPPARWPCQRLFARAMVLADGRMTLCDQDFRGSHAVGSTHDINLARLWHSQAMTSARQSHVDAAYGDLPLCSQCDEWHRP